MIDAGEATLDPALESLVTELNSIPKLRADKKNLYCIHEACLVVKENRWRWPLSKVCSKYKKSSASKMGAFTDDNT